ncbi:MAG: hypothetical protein ABEJ56_01390 [Candidatus Nanohaloarchaea archaeon]
MNQVEQRNVDDLAKKLRNKAALYCDLFKIAYGLEEDPELINAYVEKGWDYEVLKPRIENLLEETEDILPETRNNYSNREEELYRFFRRKGKPRFSKECKNWRKHHSEAELVDNQRDSDTLDYGPLIRARATVITFAMEAAKWDEDHYEWIPDIEEDDDTEIIEETVDTIDGEVEPATVASHRSESLPQESSAAYIFPGIDQNIILEPEKD